MKEETIKAIFDANDGLARTRDLTQAKVHSVYLFRLVKAGKIARIRRGLYEWIADGGKSDVWILSQTIPEATLCLHSALAYFEYVDRLPDAWHIAMDKNRSRWRAKLSYPPLKVHYVPSHLFLIGRVRGEVDDVELWIYNRERTICDVLKHANRIDPEVFQQALRSYIADREHNLPRLMEYAKQLRVERAVKQWIGVWL